MLGFCLQARLSDAMKQLLGGSAADGGLGAAELRQKLAAAEREAARANKALSEAEAKVSTVLPVAFVVVYTLTQVQAYLRSDLLLILSDPITITACAKCSTACSGNSWIDMFVTEQVSELQASSAKVARDKASLTAELTTLRDELGCCCCGAGGSLPRTPVTSPIGTPGQ